MADYSLVILVGRLTKDPELKYAQDGQPSTRLQLSVNRKQAGQDGACKKTTTFVTAVVYRHQAEIACQFLKKGSTCMVVGQLRQERREVDGRTESKIEVVADRIQFLDKKIDPKNAPSESEEPRAEDA